jgi:hypothetical protein
VVWRSAVLELQAGVLGRCRSAAGSFPSPASMETAARARFGRSSSNKLGLGGVSWPLARGPEIPLRARRGDEVGGF